MLELIKNNPQQYMDFIFNNPEKIDRCYKMIGTDNSYIMDVEISGEVAKYILENHSYKFNRPSSEKPISLFVNKIQSNEYDHRAGTFEFNTELKLINGQHRMNAIAISGKSVFATIKINMPQELFSKIDTGRKRNIASIFFMSGEFESVLESKCAQALSLPFYAIHETGKLPLQGNGGLSANIVPHETQLLTFYFDQMKDEALKTIDTVRKAIPKLTTLGETLDTPGKILFYYHLLKTVVPTSADNILKLIFAEKHNLINKKHTLYELRNWLEEQKEAKRRATKKECFETIMRTFWNLISHKKHIDEQLEKGNKSKKVVTNFGEWANYNRVDVKDDNGDVVKKVRVKNKESSSKLIELYLDIKQGKCKPIELDVIPLQENLNENTESVVF